MRATPQDGHRAMDTVSPNLVGPRDHVVLFHDDEHELVGTVGQHLADALRVGDAVIVIASAEHRSAFAEQVAALGVDVPSARGSGRLVELDAAETLARFMVDGKVDAAAFSSVIGPVVRTSGEGGRTVRAYGEMVTELWDDGAVAAAIELEQQWNDLASEVPFSLLCAYPTASVSPAAHAESLALVCHLHVAKMAPVSEGGITAHFVADRASPGAARRLVVGALHDWGRGDLVDDAALVVTELATNAVLHAESNFELRVRRNNGCVRIEVQDASLAAPVVRPPDPTAPSGRGMVLVGALAAGWGVELLDDGKVVWAELVGSGEP